MQRFERPRKEPNVQQHVQNSETTRAINLNTYLPVGHVFPTRGIKLRKQSLSSRRFAFIRSYRADCCKFPEVERHLARETFHKGYTRVRRCSNDMAAAPCRVRVQQGACKLWPRSYDRYSLPQIRLQRLIFFPRKPDDDSPPSLFMNFVFTVISSWGSPDHVSGLTLATPCCNRVWHCWACWFGSLKR